MPAPKLPNLLAAQADVLAALATLHRSYIAFPAAMAANTTAADGVAQQLHEMAANFRLVASSVDNMAAAISLAGSETTLQ